MTTTALATTTTPTTGATLAFEPRDIADAVRLAQILVASRLLPRSITTPEAAFAVICTGRELGLTAMQSLRSIHIIEGKPTMSADLMVALVKRSPVCRHFSLVETTAERAVYETQRVGDPSPTRLAFTMAEARASAIAGKDNWRKFPAAMLRARAASALVRAVYPDVLLGVYDSDSGEIEEPLDAPPAAAPRAEPSRPATSVALYVARIAEAVTMVDLATVAVEIRADKSLGPDAQAQLRELYRARKAAIDAAVTEAPAMREPGEEG